MLQPRPAPHLATLFDGPVAAFEIDQPVPLDALLPGEAEHLRAASPARRAEFAAGRLCARQGLARYGLATAALPAGPDRAPCWPGPVTGSITHTTDYAAAVVAARHDFAALGLDAEMIGRVDARLWPLVCTADERAWLGTLSEPAAARAATLLFGAKEAFYKCQYAITGAWLDFQDVAVRVDGDRFTVTPLTAAGRGLAERWPLAGRHRVHGPLMLCAVGFAAA